MKINLINWIVISISLGFMLTFAFNFNSYAWHENLGIDANKAAEFYQTKPNDPAIVQWKTALQLAINSADHCFDIESAISCQTVISTINSNCETHPNELLACNDIRFSQYPTILNQAQETQKKTEEAKKKADEAKIKNLTIAYTSKLKETKASLVIDKCIKSSNSISKFAISKSEKITDTSCLSELSSLQQECQNTISPYSYCKDERFVGYLNALNQTEPLQNSEQQGCVLSPLTMTDGRQLCIKK